MMTEHPNKLHRSRSSDHQFLFSKTDKKIWERITDDALPDTPDALSETFPDMLTAAAFLEQAMAHMDGETQFGALVIRIDRDERSEIDSASRFPVQVAETLHRICDTTNGLWGRIEADLFGCVFPGADGDESSHRAAEIQEALKPTGTGSVSIGIACYPTIDFPKSRILDNARKALDHASFFGPGSVVSFDAVSLNISGDQFYQKGDINGAIEEFKSALRLDPSNVNVRNSLGVCYGVLGDFEKAIAEFDTAARLDPSEVMAVYNQGLICLMAEENRNKALDYFLNADTLGDDIFEVKIQIGKLYLDMDQPDRAQAYLEKAADIRPRSGVARRYLGDCHAALGRIEAAIAAYQMAVKQNPNDAEALSALGCLMDKLGENIEITTTFCKHSVEIAPENGLFRYRLGRLYLKQDRLKQAFQEFQKALDLGYDAARDMEKIRDRLDTETADENLYEVS